MRIFGVILLLFFIGSTHAQTFEVGVLAGGLNNIGDVGRTDYVMPSGFAYGGIFKWNKSKRYAWRASVLHGKFVADDLKSGMASRQKRAYIMENTITEYSGGLEVNFTEYNLHRLGPAFTPYLYTGFTYFRYDYNYFEAGFVQDLDQRDGDFAIPMTVGFKYRLNQFFILAAEIGARYTFTDNLDASNPEKANVAVQIDPKFGNIFSEDWYVFSGFTFTYTFGRKPCRDCFE